MSRKTPPPHLLTSCTCYNYSVRLIQCSSPYFLLGRLLFTVRRTQRPLLYFFNYKKIKIKIKI